MNRPITWMSFLSIGWSIISRKYQGSILVISHDRAFLESVTERTNRIKDGHSIVTRGITVSIWLKVRHGSKGKEKLYVNQKKEIQKEKKNLLIAFVQMLKSSHGTKPNQSSGKDGDYQTGS